MSPNNDIIVTIHDMMDLAAHYNIGATDEHDCFIFLTSLFDSMGLMLDIEDDLVYIENGDGQGYELMFPFTNSQLEDTVASAQNDEEYNNDDNDYGYDDRDDDGYDMTDDEDDEERYDLYRDDDDDLYDDEEDDY